MPYTSLSFLPVHYCKWAKFLKEWELFFNFKYTWFPLIFYWTATDALHNEINALFSFHHCIFMLGFIQWWGREYCHAIWAHPSDFWGWNWSAAGKKQCVLCKRTVNNFCQEVVVYHWQILCSFYSFMLWFASCLIEMVCSISQAAIIIVILW